MQKARWPKNIANTEKDYNAKDKVIADHIKLQNISW